jgi:hypothetical protein
MSSVTAAFDASDAVLEQAAAADFGALSVRECFAMLQRCEKVRRRPGRAMRADR